MRAVSCDGGPMPTDNIAYMVDPDISFMNGISRRNMKLHRV